MPGWADRSRDCAVPGGLAMWLALATASGAGPVPPGAQAFADHCFSPYLTAQGAAERLAGARHDFYDLRPFSGVAPSPVTGRAATPGTDRRCEVAFDGDHGAAAAEAAQQGLTREGIVTETPLPDTHSQFETPGTTLLAARRLNPERIAVVHTGTRQGPGGVETFLTVERLTPKASDRQTGAEQ